MPRYLVQSKTTGRFLCPSLEGGSVEWVSDLKASGGGVIADLDECIEMINEYSDFDDQCQVIDLDRLGTVNDYPVIPS